MLCFLPDHFSNLVTTGRLLYNLSDNHIPFVYCTLVACYVQMKNMLIGRKIIKKNIWGSEGGWGEGEGLG